MGLRRATFKRRGHAEAGSTRALGALRVDVERASLAFDDLRADHDLFDAIETRQFKHCIEQDAFHDRTQAAGARAPLDRLLGDDAERVFLNREIGVLHLEQTLILFDERVLRLGQDPLQRILVEILEGRDDWQTADEFGNETEFQQILRLDLAKDFARAPVVGRLNLGGKADRGALAARRDDPLEAGKRPAANEQDIGRIDLQELLLGMLAAALGRNARNRALHDLEQRLLHAFARHVAGNRRIVGLAADLVDLVDVDDATLRPLDIVVGRLQQLQNDVLDVLADIAGFSQSRGVGHRERHVEDARKSLSEQGLARARRPDEQDVRFRELHVAVLGGVIEALVVIVDRDRQHALGLRLTDHIIVENLADFPGGWNSILALDERGLAFFADDVHAQFDAFIADEYGRP